MIRNKSLSPEKITHARLPWPILAFDGLLGALFFAGTMSDFTRHSSSGPQGADGEPSIRLVAGLLDGTLTALLIAAGICLLAQRRWAGLCQRAVFWALMVRCLFIGMELFLPSEGGVGGIVLMGVLLMLIVLTTIAWAAAFSLRQNVR